MQQQRADGRVLLEPAVAATGEAPIAGRNLHWGLDSRLRPPGQFDIQSAIRG